MGRASSIAAVAVILFLAGCASKPAPAPAPGAAPPPVRPVPAPVRPVVPPPAPADWHDLDLTPGDWSVSGNVARFLAADGAAFALRCDPSARRVLIEREAASGELIVRTTALERRFAATSVPLPADDPLLDAIAFSRGRFTVEAGGRTMVLPAWPEPARIVADCRI